MGYAQEDEVKLATAKATANTEILRFALDDGGNGVMARAAVRSC
jgi:hypothetical protein